MTDVTDDEEERRKKKKGEGTTEGDSDSWGRGKAGAGSAVGRVSPQKLKNIMADWRHLEMSELVEAVAEFFSELPMRASANLSVAWNQVKSNAKSFALVNWVLSFGEKAAADLQLKRERTKGAGRDTRGFQNKRENKARAPSVNMGPHPTQQ